MKTFIFTFILLFSLTCYSQSCYQSDKKHTDKNVNFIFSDDFEYALLSINDEINDSVNGFYVLNKASDNTYILIYDKSTLTIINKESIDYKKNENNFSFHLKKIKCSKKQKDHYDTLYKRIFDSDGIEFAP